VLRCGSAAAFAAGGTGLADAHLAGSPADVRVEAVPMRHVRLTHSVFRDAMVANASYMMQLEPDRLLHNYRLQAGLAPKGAIYGGWESDTIAGHTLGHYLSALSLYHAQSGNEEARLRVDYIISELVVCQASSLDGYVGGFTRRGADGVIEPGRAAFDEIAQGHTHSTGFALNGAWSPLYNWHKLIAGLLDAELHCGNSHALGICTRLGAYLSNLFGHLTSAQIQQVLACEYGGLNESFAELYARTGEQRWLSLAHIIYDDRTLDPLALGQDNLANLHANTQIPKVIGLARLYELTGRRANEVASETFWTAVTAHHCYVIGGTGDREYFSAADSTQTYVTDQTCETCASYNMLKLTRQIYGRRPSAAIFDYYERTHLNHIMAQQNPRTGMFAYMTPLMSGSARIYSTPFDDFWCCVGTGMESHAKHGDSVYWHAGADTLVINLFVPSTLDWNGIGLALETDYPRCGLVTLRVTKVENNRPFMLRVRLPGWSHDNRITLNGHAENAVADAQGYFSRRRRWRVGDRLTLAFDMRLRLERPTGDDLGRLASILRGPSVLAADLGPAGAPFDGVAPALIAPSWKGDDVLRALVPAFDVAGGFRSHGTGRPTDVLLTAFASQHERRSAVYFPIFTQAEWAGEQQRFRDEEAARKRLATLACDALHPGEMQSERDHDLQSNLSFPVVYRGRNGRDARSGGFISFRLRVAAGPLLIRATYWGEERDHAFRILVEGHEIATEHLSAQHPGIFFDRYYPIPEALTKMRQTVFVRIEPLPDKTAGPIFGLLCLSAKN